MNKRNILTDEWRERELKKTKQSRAGHTHAHTHTHSLAKGCWLTGRVYIPGADFAVGKTYDISIQYGG